MALTMRKIIPAVPPRNRGRYTKKLTRNKAHSRRKARRLREPLYQIGATARGIAASRATSLRRQMCAEPLRDQQRELLRTPNGHGKLEPRSIRHVTPRPQYTSE